MRTIRTFYVIALLALPALLFAHAPGRLTLEYDKEKEILKIDIPHSVRNVERHYIESVTITVNDEEFTVLEYSKQKSEDNHNIEHKVPGLKQGDMVEVNAACSRLGSRSAELTIE